MAEKLCELRKKGGGGGKYTETSLWTNPSPNVAFAAQTVTLSDSISNYKYVAIYYKYAGTTDGVNDPMSVIVPVDKFKTSLKNNSTRHNILILGVETNGNAVWTRNVFYASDTTIEFDTGYRQNAASSSGDICVPTEILGLNELDHGTKYTTNASEIAFKSVSANTIPTFTTVAEAKAIWLTINYASAYRALQITNVNPTTGEINNDSLYKIDTSSMGNIEPLTGNKFIVTSNSVTMQNAPSTAATQQSLIYTY